MLNAAHNERFERFTVFRPPALPEVGDKTVLAKLAAQEFEKLHLFAAGSLTGRGLRARRLMLHIFCFLKYASV
jgi:hypothetical protein